MYTLYIYIHYIYIMVPKNIWYVGSVYNQKIILAIEWEHNGGGGYRYTAKLIFVFCMSENWYSIALNGQVNGDMMIAPLVN